MHECAKGCAVFSKLRLAIPSDVRENLSINLLRLGGFGASAWLLLLALSCAVLPMRGLAITNVLFSLGQTTNLLATNLTSDTIGSEGYSFNLTRDKLFTGGVGLTNPIGRNLRVVWPNGLEAQAITAGTNTGGAKVLLKRIDGAPFSITKFTFQLLGNTAGAGAMLEVMPQRNGEDALNDPIMFQATGYYGQRFTNSPATLTNYTAYKFSIYVDFALNSLTLIDPSAPVPQLKFLPLDESTALLFWTTNSAGYLLQTTTNLQTAPWANATNEVSNDGEMFSVFIDLHGGQRFYRLRR
jgi:hypothetical protein